MCEITGKRKENKIDVLDIKIMDGTDKVLCVYPEEGL